jgi:hypothetical protein
VFLGIVFVGGGMSKLFAEHAFPGVMGPVWLEEELAKHGLGFFARGVAFAQALAGFALATLLLRTIGALMLVPMLVSMLLVTISMGWRGTPFVIAFFAALDLLILLVDRTRFAPLIGRSTIEPHAFRFVDLLTWSAGLIIFLASVGLSHLSIALGQIAALVGFGLGFWAFRSHRLHIRSTT